LPDAQVVVILLGHIFDFGAKMGNTGIKRQKSPNNLINADHYHGGKLKFIGFAKVPAVIKLIADYPWQVIKTFATIQEETMKIHEIENKAWSMDGVRIIIRGSENENLNDYTQKNATQANWKCNKIY